MNRILSGNQDIGPTLTNRSAGNGNITQQHDALYDLPFAMSEAGTNSMTVMVNIERYCLPIICCFGIIGNCLATITFFRKPLRQMTCSFYLAMRGISDTGFLVCVMITWISSTFDLQLSQVKGVCQGIIYTSYVCGCVSVWLCVFITFENFLLIEFPYLAKRLKNNNVPKICTSILVSVTLVIYNMSVWVVNDRCSFNKDKPILTQVLVFSDTSLTLVIPTVVFVLLLTVIVYKVIKILYIRKLPAQVTNDPNLRALKPIIPIVKITKMLSVVSITCFVLNVPSHAIRHSLLIQTVINGKRTLSAEFVSLQTALQIFYYLSFSVNIILYLKFCTNFRRMFKNLFCHVNGTKTRGTSTQTEAVNLVRRRRQSHMRHTLTGDVEMTNGNSAVNLILAESSRPWRST